jgi:hypothetical protein
LARLQARATAQADHDDYNDGPSDDIPSDDEPYVPEVPEDPKRYMARCIFGDAADPEGPYLTYRYTLSKADNHPAHPQPLPHELYKVALARRLQPSPLPIESSGIYFPRWAQMDHRQQFPLGISHIVDSRLNIISDPNSPPPEASAAISEASNNAHTFRQHLAS